LRSSDLNEFSHRPSHLPFSPATMYAKFQDAPPQPYYATCTTSKNGSVEAAPTKKTPPPSAAPTTPRSTPEHGPFIESMAYSSSSPQRGSIPTSHCCVICIGTTDPRVDSRKPLGQMLLKHPTERLRALAIV